MTALARRGAAAAALLLTLALASGCAMFADRRSHTATSVVDFLYPDRQPMETVGVPTLVLPLRVGIAFVPEADRDGRRHRIREGFGEKEKVALMREVGAHFSAHEFVKSIEVIPSAYLTPRGSFTNLDQLRTMFGTDVVVLLSYDQAQFTDQGALSLAYWTLVGAYVIQGERNDTSTMLDAAVYHVPSRKLLFRAPGLSRIRGSATPVNLEEELRRDSRRGFADAAKEMVTNLDEQLDLFKARVKESPEEYRIVRRAGRGGVGAGGLGALDLLIATGLAAAARAGGRRR